MSIKSTLPAQDNHSLPVQDDHSRCELVFTDKYLLAYVRQKSRNEEKNPGQKHSNSLDDLLTKK